MFKRNQHTYAIAILTTSLFSACGGGSGEDIGNAVGNAVVCTFLNCTNSDTMPIGNVRTLYTITQQNGVVNVSAAVGQTANILTVVTLTGNDSLTASTASNPLNVALQRTSKDSYTYSAQLNDASSQPTVNVSFNRAGKAYPSIVTMPPSFTLQSPSNLNLGKFSSTLKVQLDTNASANVSAPLYAQCSRADGTSFNGNTQLNILSKAAAVNGTIYSVSTQQLDAALNALGQSQNSTTPNLSPVVTCTLNVSWSSSITGNSDTELYKMSSITAVRSVMQTIYYDARV